jgi:hypothetical protein
MRRGEICPRERGRVCPDVAAYLEDCKDELHPLWVLGTWEQVWRDYLDHHTEALVDLEAAIGYLDMQMSYMSGQPMPDFVQFANELRACRTHLEDVLRDGVREERGAPCIHCQRPMIRLATETGTEDSYTCRTCRRTMEGDDYRYVVGVVHKVHADRLTADDLAERLGVTVSRIRVWGSRGYVKKHGKNADGKTLYDVADAQSRVESEPLEEAG